MMVYIPRILSTSSNRTQSRKARAISRKSVLDALSISFKRNRLAPNQDLRDFAEREPPNLGLSSAKFATAYGATTREVARLVPS